MLFSVCLPTNCMTCAPNTGGTECMQCDANYNVNPADKKCLRKLYVHTLSALLALCENYCDVIMDTMASQITSLTTVYLTIYSDADQKNIKAPRHWPLCLEFIGDRWIPHTNGH